MKKNLIRIILFSFLISCFIVLFSSESKKFVISSLLASLETTGVSIPDANAINYSFPFGASIEKATLKVGNIPLEVSNLKISPSLGSSGIGISIAGTTYGGALEASSINLSSKNFAIGSTSGNEIDLSKITPLSLLGITKGVAQISSPGGSLTGIPLKISIKDFTFSPSALLESTLKFPDLNLKEIMFEGTFANNELKGSVNAKGPDGSIMGDMVLTPSALQGKGDLKLTDAGSRTIGPLLGLVGVSNAGPGEVFSFSLRGTPQSPRISFTRKASSS